MKQENKANRLFTRNFTLLLMGQAFSLLGNGALRFALSMYVLEETGSAAVFGTLLAVSMVPTILLTPFGGVLADRVSRKKLMVGLDLTSGVVEHTIEKSNPMFIFINGLFGCVFIRDRENEK